MSDPAHLMVRERSVTGEVSLAALCQQLCTKPPSAHRGWKGVYDAASCWVTEAALGDVEHTHLEASNTHRALCWVRRGVVFRWLSDFHVLRSHHGENGFIIYIYWTGTI